MATKVRQSAATNPDSAGLQASFTTSDEDTIIRSPILQSWWRADIGFDGVWAWHCRKTQRPLVPFRGAVATLESVPPGGGFNGQPAILFGLSTLNGGVYDGGDALLPAGGSFTVYSVSRRPDANACFIWGNGDTTNYTGLQHANGSGYHYIAAFVHGTLINDTLSNHDYNNAQGRQLVMVSYDSVAGKLVLRGNRGWDQYGPTTVATPNGNSEFHIPNPDSTTTQVGSGNGTEVAELLIFSDALHLAANASLLATVEDYLGTRYNCPNGGP